MTMLIVPIPHFDSDMAVRAYWLGSHDGKKMLGLKDNFHRMDDAFFHFGLEVVERVGIEPITGGKPLFVPLSRMQLMSGLMERAKLDRSLLVCVIPPECVADHRTVLSIHKLHELGCRLALEGFPTDPSSPAMEYIDYIILDTQKPQFQTWYAQVSRMRGKTPILCGIPDMEAFNALRGDRSAWFTGSFYNRPITARNNRPLSPIKVNALRLLKDLSREDFEFEDIIPIIERDPYLSVSLLRFLNSTASGLSRQVASIPQAVTILGQDAVRRWSAIALSAALGEDRPSEITRLALVRAKFAEDIAPAFQLGDQQASLFMAGLFSPLDIMLEKPMADALREVAVSQPVRDALLERRGPLAPVLELITAYERADWDQVSILMIRGGTDIAQVGQAYLDALSWYRDLLHTIDTTAAVPQA